MDPSTDPTADLDPHDGPELDDDDAGHDAGDGGRWYQPPSALTAVLLVAALLFLGGAAGWLLGRGDLSGDEPSAVDVGFLQDMITHHEQAVEMAEEAVADAQDPTVRGYAEEVIFFQSREIGVMQTLLQDLGVSIDERPEEAMAWMDMSPVPVAAMPGLATEEQFTALEDAEESAVDHLFLELMIVHHLGGIHMAEDAARRADDPRVRDLAATMDANQTLEVGEYRALQRQLGYEITDARVSDDGVIE